MKRFSSVIVLWLGVLTLQAQTIIPKIGLSLASMSEKDANLGTSDDTMIPGISGGIGVSFDLTDKLSLQPELLYVQKGSKNVYTNNYNGDGFSGTTTFSYRSTVSYLELPVLVKMGFGADRFRFYVYAGPSVSYGLSGKGKLTYRDVNDFGQGPTVTSSKANYDVEFKDYPSSYEGYNKFFNNRLDIGGQFGGGVVLFDKIMVDVRYGMGFTTVSDRTKSKIRALQFTVGVPIRL